jgi:transcriptional regulator with XRE-family HTH domain
MSLHQTIDMHIGSQLHRRRRELQVPLEMIAAELGVTAHEAEAYESGRKELSISQLCTLAGMLGVRPEFFYDGLSQPHAAEGKGTVGDKPTAQRILRGNGSR